MDTKPKSKKPAQVDPMAALVGKEATAKEPTVVELKAQLAAAKAELKKSEGKEPVEYNENHNQARRDGNTMIAVSRPKGSVSPSIGELRKQRAAGKRNNMTEVEEELYAEYTDPQTGIPPLDVRGERGSCIIKW